MPGHGRHVRSGEGGDGAVVMIHFNQQHKGHIAANGCHLLRSRFRVLRQRYSIAPKEEEPGLRQFPFHTRNSIFYTSSWAEIRFRRSCSPRESFDLARSEDGIWLKMIYCGWETREGGFVNVICVMLASQVMWCIISRVLKCWEDCQILSLYTRPHNTPSYLL